MGRILAIDFGTRRTGLAVTDPLQMIASGLTALNTQEVRPFLREYIPKEQVERILIGLPQNLDGSDTDATAPVRSFIRLLKKDHPGIPVEPVDERYTSRRAVQALIESGVKKQDRRDKKRIDEMAATLMLQDYLAQKG